VGVGETLYRPGDKKSYPKFGYPCFRRKSNRRQEYETPLFIRKNGHKRVVRGSNTKSSYWSYEREDNRGGGKRKIKEQQPREPG